jgi:ABC-type phosphate/phosphonate transport system substrate-binding protein
MNWRKWGILLMVLVFAVTMVMGCGQSEDNGSQAPDQAQSEEFKVGFIYPDQPSGAWY